MDLGTAILGMVAIAICVLPLIWLHRIQKKAANTLLFALTEFASKHHAALSTHEVHRDFAIGMDESKACVFFIKKSKDEDIATAIDLSEIKTCKVINTNMSFNTHDGVRKVIEKLELSFIPAVESKSTVNLELYDMDKNVQLSGELQLIERWADRINEWLKSAK